MVHIMARNMILVINPGSTSTKIAVYGINSKTLTQVFSKSASHTEEELKPFTFVMEQLAFRKSCVMQVLLENGVTLDEIALVMARGGMIPPCATGTYEITKAMVDYMFASRLDTHISNVACAVAKEIADEAGVKAYICDPVTVNELSDIAKLTGLPEIIKESRGHALNSRAMAIKCANEVLHKPFNQCTIIVEHLGGGNSTWLFENGRAVDMSSDDDAGFAPERIGAIQALPLVKLCYSGKYTKEQAFKLIRGNAGLRAHLGTADAREVEAMIDAGDEHARLVYDALAYTNAKGIGALAAAAGGKVDRIVLTGGLMHSKRLSAAIADRVKFIAPVVLLPGENEMEALASGGLRVLSGEEQAKQIEF